MKYILDKFVEKLTQGFLCSITFSPNRAFWDNMKKYYTVEPDRPQMTV